MDLAEALRVVRDNLKGRSDSKHFHDQLEKRGLDREMIERVLSAGEPWGIVEPDEGLYKVWFAFEKDKDLNVVIRIVDGEQIRLVTLFPCDVKRRRR